MSSTRRSKSARGISIIIVLRRRHGKKGRRPQMLTKRMPSVSGKRWASLWHTRQPGEPGTGLLTQATDEQKWSPGKTASQKGRSGAQNSQEFQPLALRFYAQMRAHFMKEATSTGQRMNKTRPGSQAGQPLARYTARPAKQTCLRDHARAPSG